MAYFLGRDVVVALTTEDASALVCSVSNTAAIVEEDAYASQTVIAGPRLDLGGLFFPSVWSRPKYWSDGRRYNLLRPENNLKGRNQERDNNLTHKKKE